MNKILTITLTGLCLLSLCACTNKPDTPSAAQPTPPTAQTPDNDYRGCCSSHKGVKSCTPQGVLLCNDGTHSTCKCNQ